MNDAVIVSARRTPIGRRNGALSSVHPHDLLGVAQTAAIQDAGVAGSDIDLIITGCVTKAGEQAYNIARLAALASGIPVEVPGITLDAQCGSSQQGVNMAAAMIQSGAAETILVSGVESMSRVPLGTDRTQGPGDALSDSYRARFEDLTVGESAERIADKWKISRDECDAWSARSHRLAGQARDLGWFNDEIAPVMVDGHPVTQDEGIRESTMEVLSGLKPAFRQNGVLSAGSSSQISDGAAAVVVMSADRARQVGAKVLATIEAHSIVGVDPILRLTGPIPVTQKLVTDRGMRISDVDHFEVNEAFASVVLAWLRETDAEESRVNPSGGAIALGHPVGSTGARLITTAVHALHRAGTETALVAMCCGGGLGTGTFLRRE